MIMCETCHAPVETHECKACKLIQESLAGECFDYTDEG